MLRIARKFFYKKFVLRSLLVQEHKKGKKPETYADRLGRVCTHCLQYKTRDQYQKNTAGFMGYRASCTECCNKERKYKRLLKKSATDKKKGFESVKMKLDNVQGVLVDKKLGG